MLLTSMSFNFKMIIPKKNRIVIYEPLFKDRFMAAIKNGNKPSHQKISKIGNIEVMCAMKAR